MPSPEGGVRPRGRIVEARHLLCQTRKDVSAQEFSLNGAVEHLRRFADQRRFTTVHLRCPEGKREYAFGTVSAHL